jgi:hypothetical protein
MPLQTPNKADSKVVPMGTTNQADTPQGSGAPPAKSLFDSIPIPLVLLLASPYLAGQNAEEAISLAQKLYKENKFSSTLDILGEDMSSDDDCDAWVEHYKHLIDAISQSPLPVSETRRQPTVSFKPSMFATTAPIAGQVKSAELDQAVPHKCHSGSRGSPLGRLPTGDLSRFNRLRLPQYRHRFADQIVSHISRHKAL